MREDELREVGALTGAALGEVSRGVHRIHSAIAGRVRRALGRVVGVSGAASRPGAPGRPATGPITALTYAAVDLGLVATGRAGGLLLARARADDRAAADVAPRLLAALNGSHGHLLHDRSSPLALTATLRWRGQVVPVTAEGLRTAWPTATGAVAVYLHGLVDTESCWGRGGGATVTLPERLERDRGLTPVLVRYNSGRRIEHNADDLAVLLDALVSAWPVPVTRIVLVGHSMGGLVARRAVATGASWVDSVTDLVTLGSPHGGAWLERAVERVTPRLAEVAELAWVAEQLAGRSDGIRDLAGGAEEPIPATIRELAVVGSLLGARSGAIGRAVGDVMVGVDSATGARGVDDVLVLEGVTHFVLPRDPRLGDRLVDWLAGQVTESR